jgi:DDE family transposase
MIRRDILMLISIFCDVDDFCKEFEPEWRKILIENQDTGLIGDKKRRNRRTELSLSEAITIVTMFHKTRYRTFKDYYHRYVLAFLKPYFPKLLSYSRFVNLMKTCLFPLFVFSQGCLGECSGISFVDSTILTVCHARRINSHRVFKNMAKRGKTSTGWFYGFKLHLIINDSGEIIAYMLTAGNIDDRVPIPWLSAGIFGKLFGDKGYISQKLFLELYDKGIQIITRLKKNMKNKLMHIVDKILLRSRGVIESVNNKLKADCQIEHHRHRSPWNFLVNLVSGIVAYAYDSCKPSIQLTRKEKQTLLNKIIVRNAT